MSRTRNNQLIGAAAHAQKLDDMREINYQIDRQAAELKAKTLDACERIASILTPTQYAEWWETTPDNNSEFYAAARTKLDELTALDLPAPVIISGGEVLELSLLVPPSVTSDDDEFPF